MHDQQQKGKGHPKSRCLSVHLTDLCNSKCDFCVVGSPLYLRDSIVFDEVVRFLEDNMDGGFDVVNIHGGEATIHPRFFELLEVIGGLGYPEVHLQTNGITAAARKTAQRMVELGVSLFIVSLHGHVAELQDSQTRTKGGFERTVAGIRHVHALGARVRTNTVITQQNLEFLPDIAAKACDLGADHVNLSNLHPVGSAIYARGRMLPTVRDLRPVLRRAVSVVEARSRRVTIEGFPHCVVPDCMKYHLDREYRMIRMLMRGTVIAEYDSFMDEQCRRHGPPCQRCLQRDACGGVYPEYAEMRGWGEFQPLDEMGRELHDSPTRV